VFFVVEGADVGGDEGFDGVSAVVHAQVWLADRFERAVPVVRVPGSTRCPRCPIPVSLPRSTASPTAPHIIQTGTASYRLNNR
jgi:hypothetical protein